MVNCKHKEYIAFLLDEYLENLEIKGLDYMSEEAIYKVQNMIKDENSDLEKTLKSE